MSSPTEEKLSIAKQVIEPTDQNSSIKDGTLSDNQRDNEVFKESADGVDFRTVTWQRLIIILLKVQVATGVLSIPSALGSLGAVPGAICIVGWQALNTCKLDLSSFLPLLASMG